MEAESEFSGWDLSLGFGCLGIHPKERTEEAGAALAETAAKLLPRIQGDTGVRWVRAWAWALAAARPKL